MRCSRHAWAAPWRSSTTPTPPAWPRPASAPAKGVTGTVLVITLGTGIGSAFIFDGKLVPNAELGHLEIDGFDAETKASAVARERDGLSWEEYTVLLQRYFSHVEFLFSPELFIVGGGISKRADEYLPRHEAPHADCPGGTQERRRHRGRRHRGRADAQTGQVARWPAPGPGVVIVTGGSRGIGAAIALRAARAGYAVVVNYSNDADGAAAVVEAISAERRFRRWPSRPTSATRPPCPALFDAAAALGPLAAVVNNAGHHREPDRPPRGRARGHGPAGPRGQRGRAHLCLPGGRTPARPGPGRTGGSIINISSTATKAGSPGTWVHYAASKGAVDVLTVGLAAEVAAQGIRVNCVAPGSTNTGLHAAAGMPDRVEQLNPTIPMGRGAEPDEVAAAVLWLLSAEAGVHHRRRAAGVRRPVTASGLRGAGGGHGFPSAATTGVCWSGCPVRSLERALLRALAFEALAPASWRSSEIADSKSSRDSKAWYTLAKRR